MTMRFEICPICGERINIEDDTEIYTAADIKELKGEIELKDDALRTALGELEGIWSFYGTGLTVNNWHLNGDEEPWDTFFEENSQDAISEIKQALTKPEEESNDDDKNT